MGLRIVPGTANPLLAGAIARALSTRLVRCELERFPDTEMRPTLGRLGGDDVYVIQPTGPPVSDHLLELLLLLDACRRGGAGRITAVLPYFDTPGKIAAARTERRSVPGSLRTRWLRREPIAWSWWIRIAPRWRRCAASRSRC